MLSCIMKKCTACTEGTAVRETAQRVAPIVAHHKGHQTTGLLREPVCAIAGAAAIHHSGNDGASGQLLNGRSHGVWAGERRNGHQQRPALRECVLQRETTPQTFQFILRMRHTMGIGLSPGGTLTAQKRGCRPT